MIAGIDGFAATLNAKLNTTDLALPLSPSDKQKFLSRVGLVNHTYLILSNGIASEVVKASSLSGEVVIERGKGGTIPITVPAGSCVKFEATTPFITEIMANSSSSPAICEVVAGGGIEITPDTVMPCRKIFKLEEQAPVSWRSGNQQFTQDKFGVITAEALTAGVIADGTYQNATIIVEGGQIKSIQSGTNVVYTGGGLCTNCGGNGCGCPPVVP